jgi:hypothetical protein
VRLPRPLRCAPVTGPSLAPPAMKPIPRVLVPLLVLTPLALASEWIGDRPLFQPKSGTALTKHVAIESELKLEDMSVELDGQDRSDAAGQVEVAMKIDLKLGVTDHYESLAEGRPAKLKRSYDEISSNTRISGSNPVLGAQEQEIPLSSELEGTTVVFTWDDGDSTYHAAYEGEEGGDKELLEDLQEDLDLRGFLPTSEVAKGDSWKIPAEAVKFILAPGGDVKLRAESAGDMTGMNQFSQNDMIGELEGDFQATYDGTRTEGETHFAVIKLDIKARSARDMSARLDDVKSQIKENLPPGMEVDLTSLDGEYEIDAEGELHWNLETGLVHELQLSGQMRMVIDMAMSMKMGDKSTNMESSQTFAGTQTISLTTGE